jgi:biotin carboxyl carrier protein
MIGSFFYVAMDQVANQAAKLPYMSGGQIQLPMVLFAASGPSGAAAAQHSENPHPMMMNVAGLKIVMPGTRPTPRASCTRPVREPSPVLFFHDAALSGMKGPVPEGPYEVPLGVADVKREGDDVTVVAIGGLVRHALKAAEQLAEEGISAEVVDPRSLVPLDEDAILRSVAKTGRLVVCDNARRTCSARRRSRRWWPSAASRRSRPRRGGSPGRTRPSRSRPCSRSGCSSTRARSPTPSAPPSAPHRWPRDARGRRAAQVGHDHVEGKIAAWEVAVGDHVTEGQPLAAITTDKVESDVEAPVDGVVEEILIEAGTTVEVGTVIARIRED